MKLGIAVITLIAGLAIAVGVIADRASSSSHDKVPGEHANTVAHGPTVTGRDSGRQPVLVELFTSEGCSSCPPADQVLTRLQQDQPIPNAEIVTLSEHVDYWNHLGWKDPYSDAKFSRRQSEYNEAFGTDGVYTPQMIVDGRSEFVGSDYGKARSEIAKAAAREKAKVAIEPLEDSQNSLAESLPVKITVDPAGVRFEHGANVILALTESGLKSSVARGENAGRLLTHSSVVRDWVPVGEVGRNASGPFNSTVTARIQPKWDRSRMSLVVFVQDKENLQILGVGSVKLAGGS